MKTSIALIALICLGSVFAACPDGQFNVSPTICWNCPTGCATCSGADACTACDDGYTLDGQNCRMLDVTCAVPLCDVAGTQGCAECAAGYRFAMKDTETTSFCIACTQANCASCTADACTECYAGFVLDNNACVACGAGCAECSAAATCTTCAAGYFGTGTCTACSSGCVECTDAATCTACGYGYVMATAGNACVAKEGCVEGTDAEKCKTCATGYRLLADGSCTACTGNAQTCSGTGTDQVIGECNPGFIKASAVSGDTPIKEACQAITSQVCLDQSADGICKKCPTKDVLKGTRFNNLQGWVISKGACVQVDDLVAGCRGSSITAGDATTEAKCTECDTARGYVEQANPTGACVLCSAQFGNCASCSTTACTQCQPGSYLSGTNCVSCDAGDAGACSLNDATECLVGSGKQKHGICFKCDPTYNCKTCSSYQTCLTCATGSGIQTANTPAATKGKCNVCDPKCAASTCPDGPGTCAGTTPGSECTGDYLLNSTTKKCTLQCEAPNCITCDANDAGKCAANGCKSGYYAVNGVCTACVSTHCDVCTDATTCTSCKDGYALEGTTSYCTKICVHANGIANVKQCTLNAGTYSAFVCNAGSGFTTGSDPPCNTCTDANCATCPAAVGTCTACKDGWHTPGASACGQCQAKAATCTSASVDVTCKAGNCLGDDGSGNAKCFTCPANCTAGSQDTKDANILSDGLCPAASCASGWTNPAAGAGTCLQCTQTNCATCTAAALGTCTGCKSGFGLTSTGTCMANKDSSVDGCVRANGTYEQCSSCNPGWYKDGTTCKACPANCTCAAANTCDACKVSTNFYDGVSSTKSCKVCSVADCLDCAADVAKCTTCKTGWFKESDTKCTKCLQDCADCSDATTCTSCAASYYAFTMPPTAEGATTLKTEVTYCAKCVANCKACTVALDGSQTCTECNANYYLNGKNCANADCSGTDGKVCNRCSYGFILKDGKCADCKADNSCPASCDAATGGPAPGPGAGNNTTSNTDGSSKIAFSLLVLAFFAILGHMMI